MPTFIAETADGRKFEVGVPEGTSKEEAQAYAAEMLAQQQPLRITVDGVASDNQPVQPAQKPQKSEAYRAGERMSTAGRALVNTAQGTLMNFAPRIGGVGAAAVDKLTGRNPGVPFEALRQGYTDVLRGASDSFSDQYPMPSVGLQVAGSLPLAFASIPLKAGATALQRLSAAAKFGAGAGAVSSAGASADLTDPSAAGAIGLGAAVGGALGPAMSIAGAGAGGAYRNVASRFNKGSAQDYAMGRVANAFLQDSKPGANTLDDARAQLATLGREARVADLGGGEGQNARGLLDTMAILPGATKNEAEAAIRSRQVSRPARLDEATNAATGANGRRLYGTVDDLVTQRKTDSDPLYAQVRGMAVPADPTVTDLVNTAKRLGLHREAAQTAEREGLPFTLQAGATQYAMGDLDLIKRAVDDKIGAAMRAGKNDTARSWRLYRDRLVGHLDPATGGAYAQARSAYAGPSAMIDAAEQGRTFLNGNIVPDQLRADLNKLGASERDAFMVGVNEALRLKAGAQAGQTELMGLWKNRNLQERLRAVFPDQQTYDAFAKRMAGEERLNRLNSVGRGSPTAPRQAALDDETGNLLSTMGDLAAAKTGSPSAMVSLVRNMYGRAAMPAPVRDEIGRLMLRQGDDAAQTLGDMSKYIETEAARRARSASRAGMTGALTGNGLLGLLQ
jgi:hypothetical protein